MTSKYVLVVAHSEIPKLIQSFPLSQQKKKYLSGYPPQCRSSFEGEEAGCSRVRGWLYWLSVTEKSPPRQGDASYLHVWSACDLVGQGEPKPQAQVLTGIVSTRQNRNKTLSFSNIFRSAAWNILCCYFISMRCLNLGKEKDVKLVIR